MRWTVPSATQKGVTYEVAADTVDGRLRCNCLAGVYDKPCWHVKAVASGAMGRPRVRYQPAPAPRAIPAFDDSDLWGDSGASIERSLAAMRTRAAVAS